MKKLESLRYEDLSFASKLMKDYYGKSNNLQELYENEPNLAGLKEAASKRKFDNSKRELLHRTMSNQFFNLSLHDAQKANLDLLLDENTLTITTGHQLCLFTGPLYSIYKIVSTIKLTQTLNNEGVGRKFVPIFWLASEDHDFEEVNHANVFGKRIVWDQQAGDAVGRMLLTNIEHTIKDLFEIIGESKNALEIKMLVSQAYSSDKTLSQATRLLIHELFKGHGLLILDADDKDLKRQFSSTIAKELSDNSYQKIVEESSVTLLSKGYKKQVNPREINLFYLYEGQRRRIEKVDGTFIIDESEVKYTEKEILSLLSESPERFSPNVILRPLYQETILPNIAYIGGAGELNYWFQLKKGFGHFNIPFPTLLLRNSATLIDANSQKKLNKLELPVSKMFGNLDDLLRAQVEFNAGDNITLTNEKSKLIETFDQIIEKSKSIDPSLLQFTSAEKKRLENSVNVVEKKMLQAEKRKQEVTLNQIRTVSERLFPEGGLQERNNNVFQYFLDESFTFVDSLIDTFDPLEIDHVIFQIEKDKKS